jgi:hypothetical protein
LSLAFLFVEVENLMLKLSLSESQKETLESQKATLETKLSLSEMDKSKLRAQADLERLRATNAKTTTEKVLARGDDVLADAFNGAEIVQFWLPDLPKGHQTQWTGSWKTYEKTNPENQETKTIQPAIEKFKFASESPYVIKHTNKGWERMTPDAMLFVKGRSEVPMSIAALFEWVGQDEKGWPSKAHKAKFVRDCIRLWRRCGGQRVVHGVISDLSRAIAVRFTGLSQSQLPLLQKTVVVQGERVQTMLEQFAFAPLSDLGVLSENWEFPAGGSSSRPMYETVFPATILGTGLHGTVYTSAKNPSHFIKTSKAGSASESKILEKLLHSQVPHVPTLISVAKDGTTFEATPVGAPVSHLQGQAIVWEVGAHIVTCLQGAHKAGLCHRDVRPSNIIYEENPFTVCVFLCMPVCVGVGGLSLCV